MKKIKVLSTAALCGLAVTALASCGGNNISRKVIKFYNTAGATLQEQFDIAIESFQSKYEGWTVESSQIGGYDDVYSNNIASLTAGDQCDVTYCYSDHVAAYIQSYNNGKNSVLDLNQFINSTEEVNGNKVGYTAEEIADFVPGYYAEGKATNYADYDSYGFKADSMLTMPFVKSTELMYVNVDALKDAGIVDKDGNAKIPETWDELWDACEILKKKYPTGTPLCYDSEANWLINMCEQNGWNYTSASAPYYTFKDDENLASWMDTLAPKYEKGLISTQTIFGAYTSDLFKQGAETGCVFCIGSSGGASYQSTSDFKWEVAPMPGTKKSDDTIDKSVISQGPSLCMFDSGSDEKNTMTWLFVKELLEPEFQSSFSQSSGYNPCRLSTYELSAYEDFLGGEKINAKAALVAKDLTEWFFTSPAFPGSADARSYIQSALVATIKGDKTGKAALANAYKNCGGK